MRDAIHAQLVRSLAAQAMQRAVDLTIQVLSKQPSILAGEESGLGTVWLEFCVQVQREESIDWDAFVLHVRQTIEGALLGFGALERQALWLRTPAGRDWLDDTEPDTDQVDVPVDTEDLVEAVYGKVYQTAMDWDDDRLQRYLYPSDDSDSLYDEAE